MTDASLVGQAKVGIRNLVEEVAGVQPGERVLILSEFGRVDRDLPDLMADGVKQAGGESHVLWTEPLEPARTSAPDVVLRAIQAADRVIYNLPAGAPSNMPVSVFKFLDKGQVPFRVTNNFCTVQDIATDYATLSWRTVRAIYDLIEEMGSSGKTWHINTPSGTDVGGRIAEISSRQVILEEQRSSYAVNFPIRVHCPIGVADVEGVIAIDHQAVPPIKIETPPRIVFEHDRVARVEGGREADEYRTALEANAERWGEGAYLLDSWHGGLHPHAPNMTGFFGHASCARMHFHVGRSDTYVGAGIVNHTLRIDDRPIVDGGKLVLLEGPAVRQAVGL